MHGLNGVVGGKGEGRDRVHKLKEGSEKERWPERVREKGAQWLEGRGRESLGRSWP